MTRVSAAFLGSLVDALLLSVLLDRLLGIGFLLALPLWVAGICTVYLSRSGARAWAGCLGLGLVLALLLSL